MRPVRQILLGGLGLALAAAGAAWACTQQPVLVLVSGPSVTQPAPRVAAEGFAPGIPVQIRWGDQSGPVLAAHQGPSFSTDVLIPTSAPGVYYVVATQQDPAGNLIAKSGVAVKVPSSSDAAPRGAVASDAWAGFSAGVPSLGPGTEAGGSSSGSTGAGAAVLGAGLVSLAAAGAVLGLSRRRAGIRR